MIVINTVSGTKFSFNGVTYHKNFMPFVTGDKIAIINVYDACITLTDAPTHFSEYTVNGVTYTSVEILQASLLDVIYTRLSLGTISGTGTVTNVSLLLGSSGSDINGGVASPTTTPIITLNFPNASSINRGVLSSADWITFNGKQDALGFTPYNATNPAGYITSATLSGYVTLDTTQTITGEKTFSTTSRTIFTNNDVLQAEFINSLSLTKLSIGSGTLASNISSNGSLEFKTNYPTDLLAKLTISTTGLVTIANQLRLNSTITNGIGVYTLPNATGTLALTSDIPSLANYVTLNTAQTITAAKTFSTSGSANTLNINHTSGSGIALNILKDGNGEALTIVKGSGSGNAASITGGITLLSELNLTTKLADAHIASAAVWNAKIGGSGTTNYLAKFTASGVVGNSQIFDNGTNVGIGTTSPLAKLHIASNYALMTVSGANNLNWELSNATVKVIYGVDGLNSNVFFGSQTNHDAVFRTNNTARLRITSTGNVGINTTSPTSKLQVVGLPEYATNALAITGGLTVGAFYHTAGVLKVVI